LGVSKDRVTLRHAVLVSKLVVGLSSDKVAVVEGTAVFPEESVEGCIDLSTGSSDPARMLVELLGKAGNKVVLLARVNADKVGVGKLASNLSILVVQAGSRHIKVLAATISPLSPA